MDAAHLVRSLGGHRQLHDGERRGVGGDDRLGLDDAVEVFEQVALGAHVLDDALDDEIAIAEIVEVVGDGDPPEDRLALVLGQALAGHLLGESGIEAVQHGVGAGLGARAHDDVESGAGGDFGEPGSHDPGPDDSNGADRSHTRKLATGR